VPGSGRTKRDASLRSKAAQFDAPKRCGIRKRGRGEDKRATGADREKGQKRHRKIIKKVRVRTDQTMKKPCCSSGGKRGSGTRKKPKSLKSGSREGKRGRIRSEKKVEMLTNVQFYASLFRRKGGSRPVPAKRGSRRGKKGERKRYSKAPKGKRKKGNERKKNLDSAWG